MGFITRYWSRIDRRFWCALWLACLCALAGAQGTESSASAIEVRREPAVGIVVDLNAQLELSNTLQDALQKGMALTFTLQADVVKERWYWWNKVVASSSRQYRLTYLPLTRVWKLAISRSGGVSNLALTQSYADLEQALVAMKRVSNWTVAEAADLDPTLKYRVDVSFGLDQTQLPRPFQIAINGDSEWNITFARSVVVDTEVHK